MKIRFSTLLLLTVVALTLHGQDTTALFVDIAARSEARMREAPGDDAKIVREAYQSRDTLLVRGLRDSAYLFDDRLLPYVDSLFGVIIAANDLKIEPLVFLERSWDDNARSLGDGIFVVDLALLKSALSEEELLFVICHELAHDQLSHHADRIADYTAQQRAMAPTLRKLYNPFSLRGEKFKHGLQKSLRDDYYGRFRSQRGAELAADSLGLIYLSRLGYSAATANSALGQLTQTVVDTIAENAFLELLATETCPIKPAWVSAPPKLFGGSFGKQTQDAGTFWQADSVSTHPEMPERQARMQQRIQTLANTAADTLHHPIPRRIAVEEELFRVSLRDSIYGLSLVSALRMLHREPQRQELRDWSAKSLLGVYASTRNHSFDDAVPPAHYFGGVASQSVIRMLRQMRQSELRQLTLAYLSAYSPKILAGAGSILDPE